MENNFAREVSRKPLPKAGYKPRSVLFPPASPALPPDQDTIGQFPLALLAPGGALGFICADRWMKNCYGRPLRQMVANGYRL